VDQFVTWYNTVHLHSAIRFVTPDDRHYGREPAILANRHRVYQKARQRRPDRWTKNTRNWNPVRLVFLNPEKNKEPSSHIVLVQRELENHDFHLSSIS